MSASPSPHMPGSHRIGSFGDRYLNRLTTWLRPSRRKAAIQEWDSLSVEDRFRLAADIGLNEPEMDWAIHHGAGSRELSVILARLAKRGTTCSLGVLRDMQRVCNLCEAHARCRVWLARAEPNAVFPNYCLNAVTLASLRQHARKAKQ